MYGLEVLESMNNREMDKYHKEQRRKKDAIKNAIQEGLSDYLDGERETVKHIIAYDLLDCIDKHIDKLDLENREDL